MSALLRTFYAVLQSVIRRAGAAQSRKSVRSTLRLAPSSRTGAPLRMPTSRGQIWTPAGELLRKDAESSALARHKERGGPGSPNSPTVRSRRAISSSLSLSLALSPSLRPLHPHARARSAQDGHHERFRYVGTVPSAAARAKVEAREPPSRGWSSAGSLARAWPAAQTWPAPSSTAADILRVANSREPPSPAAQVGPRVRERLQDPRLPHGAAVGVLPQRLVGVDSRCVRRTTFLSPGPPQRLTLSILPQHRLLRRLAVEPPPPDLLRQAAQDHHDLDHTHAAGVSLPVSSSEPSKVPLDLPS